MGFFPVDAGYEADATCVVLMFGPVHSLCFRVLGVMTLLFHGGKLGVGLSPRKYVIVFWGVAVDTLDSFGNTGSDCSPLFSWKWKPT